MGILLGISMGGPPLSMGNPRPSRDRRRGGLGGIRPLWIPLPSASWPLPLQLDNWTR